MTVDVTVYCDGGVWSPPVVKVVVTVTVTFWPGADIFLLRDSVIVV